MNFRSNLQVEEGRGRCHWFLTAALIYKGTKDEFIVPAGFGTDFASVPRLFWAVFPPYGRFTKAAVVHDWLYRTHAVSRKDADGIFHRIMRELGTKWWRRRLMYLAVRLFGWYGWRKNAYKRQ